MTQIVIGRRLNHLRNVLGTFLRLGVEKYTKKRRPEKPSRFFDNTKRTVLRDFCSFFFANWQKNEPGNGLHREVATNTTKCKKITLTQFCKKYVHCGDFFDRLIFSDEKKFQLDGFDGFNQYWHDLRRESKLCLVVLWKVVILEGGDIMVRAALKKGTKSKIAFMNLYPNTRKCFRGTRSTVYHHSRR